MSFSDLASGSTFAGCGLSSIVKDSRLTGACAVEATGEGAIEDAEVDGAMKDADKGSTDGVVSVAQGEAAGCVDGGVGDDNDLESRPTGASSNRAFGVDSSSTRQGFSKMDGIFGDAGVVVAHGFVLTGGTGAVLGDHDAVIAGFDDDDVSSASSGQAPSVRPVSSASFGVCAEPSFPAFALYASCTADSAAVAFDDRRPHIDFMPPLRSAARMPCRPCP